MASLALPASVARPPAIRYETLLSVLMLGAALLLRAPHLLDPAYGIDEQFYLVAGDRLLHGVLPYVDLWDRKPIGLFLLYAAVRLLGGAGVWQYQLVATLFAAATAWTIARLAAPSAGRFGAAAAGFSYLLWIETVEGGGGQAPVFYNLLVALAAEQVLLGSEATEDRAFRRYGLRAMLLIGLALQIKYTVGCEGFYFGAVLAWRSMRRWSPPCAARHVAILAGVALAPTLLALGTYAALGHAHDFLFANFVSIFARSASDPAAVHARIGQLALHLLPFAICWAASWWETRHDDPRNRRFVAGWLLAALAGFAAVGTFYVHYALPLLVPASLAAAPVFRRRPIGRVMAALLLLLPASHLGWPALEEARGHARAVQQLAKLIPPDVDHSCLQLFGGPPILYLATHACMASRFPFPDHLLAAKEKAALGIDRAAEIRRLFARRPGAIVIAADPVAATPALLSEVRAELARSYRRAGAVPVDEASIEVFVPR